MALVLIKEDGTGRSDANAYASSLDGDAYHEGHLYATAWTAASNANKDKALVMATRLIDSQYQFNGSRAKSTQALQWPREECRDPDADGWNGGTVASNAVPSAVVEATCEMARELIIVDRTAAPLGEGIAATWTDTGGTKYTWPEDKRPIISHVAQAMLAKFGALIKHKGGPVKLVRA